MQNSQNKKKLQIVLLVLIAVLTLGIGYASITAVNLIINGNGIATANKENFKVYFTTSSITEGKGTVSIDEKDPTIGYFDITGLSKVGDYAEATYTVLNNSNGVGAEISLSVTNSNSEYFKVTETIQDNKLQAGDITTATVKVEMIKTPIVDSVSTSVSAKLIATPLENASATGGSPASKVAGEPVSFATDSWATIQKAIQNNNTSAYNIGDTKEVLIDVDGDGIEDSYTVRLVNKSTYDWCEDESYSQTACGFVVEFTEIIEKRAMNSTYTNLGGWPATELRTYLNGTFYNSLPSDLRAAIKSTKVISGYGNNGSDSSNLTSNDRLYLLSGLELFGTDTKDTASSTTIQLEYYQNSSNRKIKQYNGLNTDYWLRLAISDKKYNFHGFRTLTTNNSLNSYGASYDRGIAPAFRIG